MSRRRGFFIKDGEVVEHFCMTYDQVADALNCSDDSEYYEVFVSTKGYIEFNTKYWGIKGGIVSPGYCQENHEYIKDEDLPQLIQMYMLVYP